MVNCPKCNTPNDPSNQFCMNCGAELKRSGTNSSANVTAQGYLGLATFRFFISLIGLWLLNTIIQGLSFVKELTIPDFTFGVQNLITVVIFLLAVMVLIAFANSINYLWKRAYPTFAEAGGMLVSILYLILVSVVYKVGKLILLQVTTDHEPLMIAQVVLTLIALIILFRVGLILYHVLPIWYARMQNAMIVSRADIQ